MTHAAEPTSPLDPLDELVDELIAWGDLLGRLISQMYQFKGQTPGMASVVITDFAHTVIRNRLIDMATGYLDVEIQAAAQLVGEVTKTVFEEVYHRPVEQLHESRRAFHTKDRGRGGRPNGRRGNRRR